MKAIQAWITIVIILFITVEAFQWVKGFILPLPIYVLAGAFLAIASNYDKGIGSMFRQGIGKEEKLSQTATLDESINVLKEQNENSSSLLSKE
jgi:hypothetical protein